MIKSEDFKLQFGKKQPPCISVSTFDIQVWQKKQPQQKG